MSEVADEYSVHPPSMRWTHIALPATILGFFFSALNSSAPAVARSLAKVMLDRGSLQAAQSLVALADERHHRRCGAHHGAGDKLDIGRVAVARGADEFTMGGAASMKIFSS